MWHV